MFPSTETSPKLTPMPTFLTWPRHSTTLPTCLTASEILHTPEKSAKRSGVSKRRSGC